ncbi:MAG: hypothetical protein ABIG30_01155 [Candidatus Aenigmatarchaeota archaeon]
MKYVKPVLVFLAGVACGAANMWFYCNRDLPPQVTLRTIPNYDAVVVDVMATDREGLRSYELMLDGNLISRFDFPPGSNQFHTMSKPIRLTPGKHKLTVRISDGSHAVEKEAIAEPGFSTPIPNVMPRDSKDDLTDI